MPLARIRCAVRSAEGQATPNGGRGGRRLRLGALIAIAACAATLPACGGESPVGEAEQPIGATAQSLVVCGASSIVAVGAAAALLGDGVLATAQVSTGAGALALPANAIVARFLVGAITVAVTNLAVCRGQLVQIFARLLWSRIESFADTLQFIERILTGIDAYDPEGGAIDSSRLAWAMEQAQPLADAWAKVDVSAEAKARECGTARQTVEARRQTSLRSRIIGSELASFWGIAPDFIAGFDSAEEMNAYAADKVSDTGVFYKPRNPNGHSIWWMNWIESGFVKRIGVFAWGVTLAHEWGHSNQFTMYGRVVPSGLPNEQNADCQAGVFVSAEAMKYGLTARPLVESYALLCTVGLLGNSKTHGGCLKRASAFKIGYKSARDRSAELVDERGCGLPSAVSVGADICRPLLQ